MVDEEEILGKRRARDEAEEKDERDRGANRAAMIFREGA